jgi:hypothetical protein
VNIIYVDPLPPVPTKKEKKKIRQDTVPAALNNQEP